MQLSKITIASVLKPVKDTRAYYRFGLSMRETNKYKINIIGFSTKKESPDKFINFISLYSKQRNNYSRIFSNLILIKLLFKDKPKVLIVSTYELLPAAVFSKFFLGFKLIYDVQENYSLNISQNKTLSGFKKHAALILINFIELGSRYFVDHFFFAERCYREELKKFKPHSILENRFYGKLKVIEPCYFNPKETLTFLMSGTLTEVYGILNGIQWFKAIHRHFPKSRLLIIGHVPLESFMENLSEAVSGYPQIQLSASNTPLKYEKILNAYNEADIILMPFHQIPSISPKIPSKLYESLALGKPCLISPNKKWNQILSPYPGGMEIDFSDLENCKSSFEVFLAKQFFVSSPGNEVLWSSQETEFLEVIERLSSK
jgi:hypothetical protein